MQKQIFFFIGIGFLVVVSIPFLIHNAWPVTVNQGPTFTNSQTAYTAATTFSPSSIQVQPSHIYFGSTYYDLKTISGKVAANVTGFNENQNITIHVLNSSLTNVNMTVSGQAARVKIDGTFYDYNTRWNYIFGNNSTLINVQSGRDVFVDFITPTAITSTDPRLESSGEQRASYFDGTNNWIFYYNGSNIVYRYSPNGGLAWSSPASPNTGALPANSFFGVYGEGNTVIVTYTNSSAVLTKTGTISGTSITWPTNPTKVLKPLIGANSGQNYYPSFEKNGTTLYLAYNVVNNTTNLVKVAASTNLGSSWRTSTTDSTTQANSSVVLLGRYGNNNLLLVEARYASQNFYYRTLSGGIWSSPLLTTGAGLTANQSKTNAVSITSNGTCAWVGYVPSNSGGSLKSMIFCSPTNITFPSTGITGTNLQPTISAIGNNIHLLYDRSNGIFRIINSNGTKWGPEDNPFGTITTESFLHAEKYGNMAHHVPVVWKEGTSSPFAVKFGITNIQWELDNQHQVNTVNTNKQVESTLAVSPLNQKILVSGFIDVSISSCRIYRSSDGGISWSDVTPVVLQTPSPSNFGDPIVTVAKNGTFFFTCLHIGDQTNGDIILVKSTNNGSSWTTFPNPIVPVTHVGLTDKEWIFADQSKNMTTQNNVYVCWDNQTSNNEIMFKRIQPPDSGPAQILDTGDVSDMFVNGCTIDVGPQGQVFVAWEKFNGPTTGQIKLARNYNAGKIGNWINATAGNFARFDHTCGTIIGCMQGYNNGMVLVTNYPSIAVNSTGAIHMVYATNAPTTLGDISYVMSNNCKTSHSSTDPCIFSNPITINLDGTATDQFSPILSISNTTNPQILHVMAMDKREDNTNQYWKPWDYHCHLDTDCTNPLNWYNTKISNSTTTDYDFMAPGPGRIGEYDGLASSIFREVISTWTDHRSSTPALDYNIWSEKTRS